MRVSEQSRLAARLGYLQAVTERLEQIQQQLATGKRINRASDDPAGAVVALGHRREIAFEEQIRRNLSSGISFMNATESALAGAVDVLQRARELTVQAANSTLGSENRTAIAAEIDQLINQLAQIGNTTFAGAYIFSGHKTRTPAFQVNGNPPTSVTFQGDSGERLRQVSRQDSVAVNVDGGYVFGTVFDDLITLRDRLRGSGTPEQFQESLAALDAALERMIDARAALGARVNRFEAALRYSEDVDTDLQRLRAEAEDIDLAETIVQFSTQEMAFQAVLGVLGRTTNLTLLHFLQ